MVNNDPNVSQGFVDKRLNRGSATTTVATPANYDNVGALRARCLVLNAAYWNTAIASGGASRLDVATINDLIMFVRAADDAGSI